MPQRDTLPTSSQHASSFSGISRNRADIFGVTQGQEVLSHKPSIDSSRPNVIKEESEPTSPDTLTSSQRSSTVSLLSGMLRSTPAIERDEYDQGSDVSFDSKGMQPAIVGQGIISQPRECTTSLLSRTAQASGRKPGYGAIRDIESQKERWEIPTIRLRGYLARMGRTLLNPKSWSKQELWYYVIREPASYIPSVILGLLLNILDALSYGMILFPLGQPIFADLGPDGISMFYVSCIVSQLVYSCGGSIFKGGVGSEMVSLRQDL